MARYRGIKGAQTDTLCPGRVNDALYSLWEHLIRSVSHYDDHLRGTGELVIAQIKNWLQQSTRLEYMMDFSPTTYLHSSSHDLGDQFQGFVVRKL
jgi:hypothetical protein